MTTRERKYDWDHWAKPLADGQAWMVTKYRDYTCESQSFASQAHLAARERGKKATCITFEAFVVFLMYDRNAYWKPNLKAYPVVLDLLRKYGRAE